MYYFRRDAAARRPAKSSTTAVRNSRHPIWNQTLVVEVLQEDLDLGDGTVFVAVINHISKRRIAQVCPHLISILLTTRAVEISR